MALSPCQRHLLRLQAQTATLRDGSTLQNNNAYNQMLLMFNQDRKQLKRIQSFELKAHYKRQALTQYAPWIAGTLAADSGEQDDMLMFMMLWRMDAGEYHSALDIADYALKHRLIMPDNQARSTGCAVAEEMGDAAKKGYIAKNPIPLALLQRTLELTDAEDMPDKVRGELYKWFAYSQRDNHLLQPALCSLLRALELDLNVGVKADIKQLEKRLKNQQEKNES